MSVPDSQGAPINPEGHGQPGRNKADKNKQCPNAAGPPVHAPVPPKLPLAEWGSVGLNYTWQEGRVRGTDCTPCWDGCIPCTGQPGGQGWDRVGRAALPSPHLPPTLSRCKGKVRGCDSQFCPLNTPTPILSSRPGKTRTRTDRFKRSWNFLLHGREGRSLKLEQRSLCLHQGPAQEASGR